MILKNKTWNAPKIIFFIAVCLMVLVFVITAVINVVVMNQSKSRIQSEFLNTNTYDCILVLGAGLKDDGSPSDILQDRLDGAIKLYQNGVSDTLVLSGDCSGKEYDEVSAMESYCLAQGVPQEHIVRDDQGYSTYESMENVVRTKEYRNIVVVTQRYHLYRALYIAENMGADAVGFSSDYHIYRGQLFREAREILARTKDFFMVLVSA